MPRHRAALVSAVTATVMPAFCAYAADSIPVMQPDGTGPIQQQIRPLLPGSSAAPGFRPERRHGSLRFETEAAPALARPDDQRYGLGSGVSSGSALKLSPAIIAPRTGWQFSGRLGPLRWLTPLEGDGETTVRFGGRVPGQPRMPGLGLINVGIHYTFE